MSDYHSSDPPTTPGRTWTSLSTYTRFGHPSSEDESSDIYTRRSLASPARTDYNDASSIADEAEVEAALSNFGESSSSNWDSYVLDPYNFPPRILSMITERTEDPQSRPSSFRSSTLVPPRPASAAANSAASTSTRYESLPPRSMTPGNVSRVSHERSRTASPERSARPPRSGRALDLIAFFEDKSASETSLSQSRTFRSPITSTSSPSLHTSSRRTQSESSSTYNTVPRSTTLPSLDSRSVSPFKSAGTLSSLLSPARTDSHSAYSTAVSSSKQLPRTPTSPRSPLNSVRKIVAAWKERTPSLGKSSKASSVASDSSHEGFFSIKRREVPALDRALPPVPIEEGSKTSPGASISGLNIVKSGNGSNGSNSHQGNGNGSPRKSASSGSSSNKSPFDLAELGPFAQPDREPLRVGQLWYLNVHATPPFRWIRAQAVLYPHVLILSWIAPGGGRGVITLDLLNCNEVRSVPSPNHPGAQDDIGTIAAREQATGTGSERTLREFLCPFQLLYPDGVERLGAESARERVRWVGAVWEALNRAITLPDPSVRSRSPAPSIGTIRSETTSSDSQSRSGSRSTVFVPPLDTLPDIGGSSAASVSSRSSLVGGITPSLDDVGLYRRRASDDASIDGAGMLYPLEGSKVIAPSRSSSLRRTSSLEDLNTEFKSAFSEFSEPRSLLYGKPVTVSSGPSAPGTVFVSPPPSAGKKSRVSSAKTTSESSESATFRTAPSRLSARTTPASSYYSFPPSQRAPSQGTSPAVTPLRTLQSIPSDSPQIRASTLSLRGTQSASLLGDSHDGDTSDSNSYPPSTPSSKRVTFPPTTSPKTPSKTGATALSRSPGIRRRIPRRSSSRKTSSSGSNAPYETAVEGSDKENESTAADQSLSTLRPDTPTARGGEDSHVTPTRYSYTATPTNLSERPTFTRTSTYGSIGYDICQSSDLSDFTPLSMSDSYSVVGSQPEPEQEQSDSDVFLSISERAYSEPTLSDSDVFLTASEPATFATARTPSPTSTHFTTASPAPSSTQYETAASSGSTEFHSLSTCASTEYESMESVPSSNEYHTAEVCTEYETAEKCPSSPSTEYQTVEPCPCPPTPKTASVPDIPSSPERLPTPEVLPESPSVVKSLSDISSAPESLSPLESPPSILPTPEPDSLHDPTPISTATEEDSSPVELSTPTPESSPTPRLPTLPSLSPTMSSATPLSIEMASPSSPSSIIPSMPSMETPSISTDLVTPSTISSPEDLDIPSSEEMPSVTPTSLYEELSIASTSRPPSRMSTIPSLPDESSPMLTPVSSLETSTRLSTVTESDTVPYTVSISISSESSLRASAPSSVSLISPSLLTVSSRTVSTPSISSESDTVTGTFLLPSSASTVTASLSLPQSSEEMSIPSLQSPSTPVSAVQASLYEESTGTYDSSLLEPSPSVHSLPLQENPDISYDTSFLGPTASAQSEPQGLRFPMTPVPPSPSTSTTSLPPPPPPKTPPALSPPQITIQPSSPPPPSEHTVSSPTTASSEELPVSFVEIPVPASPSKSPSSLTPSTPLFNLPPPSPPPSPTTLSPPSEPTPTVPSLSPYSSESFYPTSLSASLTRTPSSVSSVSMRSSRISPDDESLYEFDISTTGTESSPWLLSPSSESSVTHESIVSRSVTPTERTISTSSSSTPTPPSSSSSGIATPVPQSRTITPQPSFSVSVSTPWSNVPSIHSQLDTVQSDISEAAEREPSELPEQGDQGRPPSSILTHDVNRLLQYLHDVNDIRNGQHLDLHRHMDRIGAQLNDLATKIEDEMAGRGEPAVRLKDVSVGRSSVSSRTTTPIPRRSPAPTVTSIPNVRASVLSSITTSSSSISWLSSHHSEDWELMSSENFEDLPVFVQHLSNPSPSGPSSPSVSSPSSESTLSDDYLSSSLSSSLTPPQQPRAPPSPTPSVETVRPPEEQSDISAPPQQPDALSLIQNMQAELAGLRSHFEQTRQLIDEIHQETRDAADRVQIVIPSRTEVIREERAVPNAEEQRMYSDMIRDVQATLREVKDILTREGQTTTASGSTITDDIDTQHLFDFPAAPQPPPPTIPLHAPTPVPARSPPSLLNLLSQMSSRLPDMEPTSESIRLEPLPRIRIPAYRQRPRSTSPSTIIRSASAPITGTGQRPSGVPPFVPPDSSSGDDQPPEVSAPLPSERIVRDPGHRRTPIGVRQARGEQEPPTRSTQQPPSHGPPPHEVPPRLPSAPPAVSPTTFVRDARLRPQRGQVPTSQRPPQTFVGGPVPVPVPAPPPILPPEFQEILRLLRLDREARDATLQQQGEMINYMRNLNGWLERDVRDRHAEIQGVGDRIDQLRNDLSRLMGIAPAVPFVPAAYPPQAFPPRAFQGGPPGVPPPPPIGRATPFRGPGRHRRPGMDDDDDDDDDGRPFVPPPPDSFADIPAGFVPYPGYPGAPPPGFWPGGASVYSSRNIPPGFVAQPGRGAPARINVVSPTPSGRPRRSRFRGNVDEDDDGDGPFVPPISPEVSPARTDVTVRPPGPRPPPDPNAPPAVVIVPPPAQPTQQQQASDLPAATGRTTADVGHGPSAGPSGEVPQSAQAPLYIIPPPATDDQQRGGMDRPEPSHGPIIIQQPPASPGRRRSSSRRSGPRQIIVRPPLSEAGSDEDSRGRGRSPPTNIVIQTPSRVSRGSRSRSRPAGDDIGRIPPRVTRDEPDFDEGDSPPLHDRESRRPTSSRRSSRHPSGSRYGDPGRRTPREYSPEDPGRPHGSRSRAGYSPEYEDEGRPSRPRSRTPIISYPDRRGPSRASSRRRPSVRMEDVGSESESGDGDRPIVLIPSSRHTSRAGSRSSRRRDGGVTVIGGPDHDYSDDGHSPPREIYVDRRGRTPSRGRPESRSPIVIDRSGSRRSGSRRSRRSVPQVIIPGGRDDDYDDRDEQPAIVVSGDGRSPRSEREGPIFIDRPASGRRHSRSRPQSVILGDPGDDGYDSPPPVVYTQPPLSPRRSRPPSIIQSRPSSRGSYRGRQTVVVPRDPYDDDEPPTEPIYVGPPSRTRSRPPSVVYTDRPSSRGSHRGRQTVVVPRDPYEDEPPTEPIYVGPPSRTRSRPPSVVYADRPTSRGRPRSTVFVQDPYDEPRADSPPRSIYSRASHRPSFRGSRPPTAIDDYSPERPPIVVSSSRGPSPQPVVYGDAPVRGSGSPSRVLSRPPSIRTQRSYRPDDDQLSHRSYTPQDVDDFVPPRSIVPLSPEEEADPRRPVSRPGSVYGDRRGSRTPGRVSRPASFVGEPSAYADERDFPAHGSRSFLGEESPPSPPRSVRDYPDVHDRTVGPRRSRPTSAYGDDPIHRPPVSRPGSPRRSRFSSPRRSVEYADGADRPGRISRTPTVIPDDDGDDALRPSSPEFTQARTATPHGRTPRYSPVGQEELRGIPRSRSQTPVARRSFVAVPPDHEGYPEGEPAPYHSPPVLTTSPPIATHDIGGISPAAPVPGHGPLETPLVDDHLSLPPERPESTPAIPFEERMALVFNNSEDERRLRYQDAERSRDDAAVQAEHHRDEEFRAHEAERQRIFEENEAKRGMAGGEVERQIREAADEHLADVAGSVGGFEPEGDGVLPVGAEADVGAGVGGDTEAEREAEAEKAESERARSIRETVHSVLGTQAEAIHQSAQQERLELYKLLEAERERTAAQESKINSLEEEIVTLRDTHEAEKVEREREQTARLEQFQADLAQRDTDMKEQLAAITRMLEEKKEECEQLKVLNDERWARKEERWERKDVEGVELKEMLQRILDEQNEAKARELQEKEERAQQKGIDDVLEALRKQQEEQNAVLNTLADGWKADCERQQKEILDTVKATAQEQVPFNVQGYLDQFSQALADEVRMLLGEVGKLREEKRNIQHEIGFLLCTRSKYGPGGEFDPDWRPNIGMYGGGPPGGFPPGGFPGGFGLGPGGGGPGFHPGGGGGGGPPGGSAFDGPPPSTAGGEEPVGSAWRNVQPQAPPKLSKRQRRQKAAEEAAAAQAAAAAGASGSGGPGLSGLGGLGPGPGGHSLPRESWATWRPDPQFAPTPSSHNADLVPPVQPSPPGLFGPRSLSPKGKRI